MIRPALILGLLSLAGCESIDGGTVVLRDKDFERTTIGVDDIVTCHSRPLTDLFEEARAAGLGPGGGAVVVGLSERSPWRAAGLRFGDLIVAALDG